MNPVDIGTLMYDCAWAPRGPSIKTRGDSHVWDHDPTRKKAFIQFMNTAIAVCLAESDGNPGAKNPDSSARGLWQVMVSVHEAKIAEEIRYVKSEYGRDADILDPVVNTRVAKRIFDDAGGWSPWEAYNNGSYKNRIVKGSGKKVYNELFNQRALDEGVEKLRQERLLGYATAEAAAWAMPGGSLITQAGRSDTLTRILEYVTYAGSAIALFLAAGVLVILGVWLLVSGTVRKTATNLARKVITK